MFCHVSKEKQKESTSSDRRFGMSGIAEVLINQGYEVSGSDKAQTPVTDHLEQLGAKIFFDHATENIESSQVVVASSAIGSDNVEVVAAKERHDPGYPSRRNAGQN